MQTHSSSACLSQLTQHANIPTYSYAFMSGGQIQEKGLFFQMITLCQVESLSRAAPQASYTCDGVEAGQRDLTRRRSEQGVPADLSSASSSFSLSLRVGHRRHNSGSDGK